MKTWQKFAEHVRRKEHVGLKLAEIQQKTGWNQAQLANALNVVPDVAAALLDGKICIEKDIAEKLTKVLGETPEHWLSVERDQINAATRTNR